MRRVGVWLVLGLGLAAMGLMAWGSPYSRSFELFWNGEPWSVAVFLNRTGGDVDELYMVLSAPAREAQALAVGGGALTVEIEGEALMVRGPIGPNAICLLSWAAESIVRSAQWRVAGAVVEEIDVVSPVARARFEDLTPMTIVYASSGEEIDPNKPQVVDIVDIDTSKEQRPQDSSRPSNDAYSGYTADNGTGPVRVQASATRSVSPQGYALVRYVWTWEDEMVQEGPVVVREFTQPGLYWVILTVWDEHGLLGTANCLVEAGFYLDRMLMEAKPVGDEQLVTKPIEAGEHKEVVEEVKEVGELTPLSKTP